jgi:hypothetical protein
VFVHSRERFAEYRTGRDHGAREALLIASRSWREGRQYPCRCFGVGDARIGGMALSFLYLALGATGALVRGRRGLDVKASGS